jgi:hypothetical protein
MEGQLLSSLTRGETEAQKGLGAWQGHTDAKPSLGLSWRPTVPLCLGYINRLRKAPIRGAHADPSYFMFQVSSGYQALKKKKVPASPHPPGKNRARQRDSEDPYSPVLVGA